MCISVSHLDGLVYARSLFSSSANYRSVCLFGKAVPITDNEEKMDALKCIVEHAMPKRWDDARPPNETEMKSTGVMKFQIEYASAKIRNKNVDEDQSDVLTMKNWAGVLPLHTVLGTPINAPELLKSRAAPSYVTDHPKYYKLLI